MNILASLAGVVIGMMTSLGFSYHYALPPQPITTTPVVQTTQQSPVATSQQSQAVNNIGSAVSQAYGLYDGYLASNIGKTDTSMTISPGTLDDGTTLSGYVCFVIDVNTPQVEYVCGTASSTSVTNLQRGVSLSDPNATSSALTSSHRRFASVSITNYPTTQQLVRKANGTDSYSSVLSYDNGVTPTGNNDIADVGYVLSAITGTSSVSFDRQIQHGVAGETVSAGNVLYLSTDGQWYKANAATSSNYTNTLVGIAQGSGTVGNQITGGIVVSGLDTNQSGLTTNSLYFLSTTTPGALTTATTSQVIGYAKSTTELIFSPYILDSYNNTDTTYAGTNTFTGTNTFSGTTTISGAVDAIGRINMIAGESINGTATPVPVYASSTDGYVYAEDASNKLAQNFVGFVTDSVSTSSSVLVQTSGIVGWFSGLSSSTQYFAQDIVGSIATSTGTYEIKVGTALSPTKLLIQKGRKFATGRVSYSTSSSTPIVVGFRPSRISVYAVASGPVSSHGFWSEYNGSESVSLNKDNGGNSTVSSQADFWWLSANTSTGQSVGSVSSITDTGFTLVNTDTSGPNINLVWTAESN